ncbi:hypothetical protein BPNPMPFG_006979 (plasmid) [Mesorhizobium sp. AR07]|uniref:hypothetical protein n=1 Tax=Mesorhizobium sp. AR07 TaxID=2865838 RepID=UPI0021FAC4C1|nr:hypothetical protein [Mesorhizobium sp. AR07]UVK48598.1 hypothetical protein BPNPMPFG_006979 [Mesorhizobium sp. AR07]
MRELSVFPYDDVEGLVGLQVSDIGQPVRRIFHECQAGGSLGLCLHWQCHGCGHPCGGKRSSPQKLAATDVGQLVAAIHAFLPFGESRRKRLATPVPTEKTADFIGKKEPIAGCPRRSEMRT